MSIWLIRAGSQGEYEPKFIEENRVYVTWHYLDVDLAKLVERAELTEVMTQRYPDAKSRKIGNWVSQVWPFAQGAIYLTQPTPTCSVWPCHGGGLSP